MPIHKGEEGSAILDFGSGDIGVCPALLIGKDVIGAVCFVPQGVGNDIGEYSGVPAFVILDEKQAPIRMTFTRKESIDVVIWALEEAKRLMQERGGI